MAFEQVTDINLLLDRQSAINQQWLDALDDTKRSHPDVDLDDANPSVVDYLSHGHMCTSCHCPTVGVESKSQGDIIRLCRDLLSAVKLQSLIHRNANEICYFCKIKRNSNGVVTGAIHVTMNINDWTGDDGVVRPGLESLITLNKVFFDLSTNEVRIDD